MYDLVIRGGTIVASTGKIEGDLAIEGERIVQVGVVRAPGRCEIDAKAQMVLPGFVDVHTNGAAGFDLTAGLYDPRTRTFRRGLRSYREGLQRTARWFFSRGTTFALLTTIAAPLTRIERALGHLGRYLEEFNDHPFGGAFVEGTFIKDPAYCGAQNPRYLYPPEPGVFDRLQRAASGHIRMLNVPPEHGPRGWELIERVSEQGVVCVAGHTRGSFEEFRQAIRRGLRGAVHFLNGPTGSSAKGIGEGGAVEAILRSDELFVPLILDGYHVHPAYVRDTLQRVGPDRLIGVTDSMFLTGLEGVRSFVMSGIEARVAPGGEYLYVARDPSTLYGSVLTMDRAFSNLLTWLTRPMEGVWHRFHPPLPLDEALRTAVQTCCLNPARLLRLEREIGDIALGMRADLVLGELRENDGGFELTVKTVVHKGKVVAVES